jgi:hypothetical protein
MSAPEIFYRVRTGVCAKLQRHGFLTASKPPAFQLGENGISILPDSIPVASEGYIRAGDEILAGKLSVFALDHCQVGHPPAWNQDPLTGREAPAKFGKSLNYRDENQVGDIKYLWEPNRHLHLVTLAQAYYLSHDTRYLEGIRDQLTSWFQQCPYLIGPNWTSSLELAIRLINWSFVWDLVGGLESPLFYGSDGRRFRDQWLRSIYQHVHFAKGHYSRYSSANNHLIGEAAGIYVATVKWPYWKDFSRWSTDAKHILEREALLQNTPDGVNREQTTSYQQFVLDFLLIAALYGRASKDDFSAQYWERLEQMMQFILAIIDCGGRVPMIGDADDGFVVKLVPMAEFCPYKSLLATGAVLFDRPDMKQSAGEFDDKSCWLFGNQGMEAFRSLPKPDKLTEGITVFKEGGYFVLTSAPNSAEEVKAVMDIGPLGYLSIAAHGHADALAFTLSVAGEEVLIDPGTYAYHTQKKWRDYFRGTSAHNTVRVDGLNQSVIGGNFMWMTNAQAVCLEHHSGAGEDRISGEHDGYTRLSDPVTHKRQLVFEKTKKNLRVIDTLECGGEHSIEQFWHFPESGQVELVDRDLVFQRGAVIVTLKFDKKFKEIQRFKGDDEVPLGWVSRRFDVKTPAPTVVCRSDIRSTTHFNTELVIEIAGQRRL